MVISAHETLLVQGSWLRKTEGMSAVLKIIKARHGDAFIFECKKDEASFVMVVDSGPRLCAKEIVPIFKQLPQIDLLVLTHFDEDHIAGFIDYFKQYPEDALKIKEYWCNCANQIEVDNGKMISAYDNAKSFADCLREILKEHQDVRWIELIKAGHEYHNGLVDIEVIAPSEQALAKNWSSYVAEKYPAISYQSMEVDYGVPLQELAKRETPGSSQKVNNASIAFILRGDGMSYLMLGDVMAEDVYGCLTEKGYSKENPLKVDFVKVPHHGSKYNIDNNLLDIIKCNGFIISTNGGRGSAYHPDREAIAKILYHPQRDMHETIHLYFNYTLKEIGDRVRLFKEGELDAANCIVHETDLEL